MKKINFTYLIVFIIWGIIGALSALAVGCGRPHDDISNVNPDPTGQVVPNITDETENNEDNQIDTLSWWDMKPICQILKLAGPEM